MEEQPNTNLNQTQTAPPTIPPAMLAPQTQKNRVIYTLLLSIFGIVIIGGAAYGAYGKLSSRKTPNINYTASTANSQSCIYPITKVPEHAFQYGLPTGWHQTFTGDTLQLSEDDKARTAVLIYSAHLREDLTPTEAMQIFGDAFSKINEDAGATFTMSNIRESGSTATADTHAQSATEEALGKFTVTKENDFVTFKGYWSPSADFSNKESKLKSVANCFARTTVLTDTDLAAAKTAGNTSSSVIASPSPISNSLVSHQGRYFSYAIPSDWRVTGETDSGIDTTSANNDAGVSGSYVTGMQGPLTPSGWAPRALSMAGITNVDLGEEENLPISGIIQSAGSFDFTGSFGGRSVRGKIEVGIYQTADFGLGNYASAFWNIQIAVADRYASYASTLQEIANSITITNIGSRSNIKLPENRPLDSVSSSSTSSSSRSALEENSNNSWDSAMRGYEEYQSPSTGEHYDVPLNSYNPSGPDGAGYYRELPGGGGLEKLEAAE